MHGIVGRTVQKREDHGIDFAGSAYSSFLIWGICSSLSTTICTIVDSLLVGNLAGSDGLAVVNVATPVYLLYALCGVTVGIGANVRIGRLLGEAKEDEANRVFSAQLTIGLAIALACLSPLLFRDAYYSFIGVTAQLYGLADEYLRIVLWAAPIFIMYHILSASVKTDSDPRTAAISSAVVIGTNIILDFTFMKGLQMGVRGASLSLCIAETLGLLVLLTHFLKKHRMLRIRLSVPMLADVRYFLWNGFSSGSAFVFSAVVMLVFNTLLFRFKGDAGTFYVAVYGILYTVQTIPCGIFEGASVSLSTVTPFLIGESDADGAARIRRRALTVAAAAGAAIALLCAGFPGRIMGFFGIAHAAAERALQLFALSLIPMGINTVTTSFWQAIGRTRLANTLSVLRNCAAILVFGIALIPVFNIKGVALAYCASELLCLLFVLTVRKVSPSDTFVRESCSSYDRKFEADYRMEKESMERISSDIAALCDQWGIGARQSFLINFVCEEVLLNIIKFAVGSKKSRRQYYISVKIIAKGGDYILCIKDNVGLYNPFESNGDAIDNGVLNLIKKKSKKYEYQRKLIFNYLYISV